MKNQRLAAQQRGDVTYHGKSCAYGHEGERYVSNGACVQCVKERSAESKVKGGTKMSAFAVGELLKMGGPRSEQQARDAGLAWYAKRTGCGHDIVSVADGSCHLCGHVELKAEELLA